MLPGGAHLTGVQGCSSGHPHLAMGRGGEAEGAGAVGPGSPAVYVHLQTLVCTGVSAHVGLVAVLVATRVAEPTHWEAAGLTSSQAILLLVSVQVSNLDSALSGPQFSPL